MTFCSLILILIAMCLPILVYAECTLTLECGGGYGTRTMNFSDRQSCEAKLSETQSWLQSVGGGCTITNACTCEQSSEPTYTTPPPYDYEAERLRQEEEKRKIEEQRKKEEEARRKQEEFEKNKAEALKSMKGITESEPGLKGVDTDMKSLKGTPSGSLGLKGLPPEAPKMKEVFVSSWISAVKDEKNPCPGGLTSLTYFCGGGSNWPYVCCPKGAPYLNHCDCQCYNASDFDCKSYSKCEPR